MSNDHQGNPSDNSLEKELLKMWRRALENDQLTMDDDFFESGGDSLLATKLLLEIEKLTGKKLPTSLIFETGTIRELLKRLQPSDKKTDLLGCENAKIIHLFHGDFNFGGVPVKYFLEMLGKDHRIHPIPPEIPRAGEAPVAIEDMAQKRLPGILEAQPEGPYILAGHCVGSLVAFETARLLVSMGKEVKAVVMIDPMTLFYGRGAQIVFKLRELYIRLTSTEDKRRERQINTLRKMKAWDSKTKDIVSLGHLQMIWKEFKACQIAGLHHPFHYLFSRKLRERMSAYKELPRTLAKNRAEAMLDAGASGRFKYYEEVLVDYKPRLLDVPVLYISVEFSGSAWRRFSPNTVFVNIYRGNHLFWEENYAPYVFEKIREYINR